MRSCARVSVHCRPATQLYCQNHQTAQQCYNNKIRKYHPVIKYLYNIYMESFIIIVFLSHNIFSQLPSPCYYLWESLGHQHPRHTYILYGTIQLQKQQMHWRDGVAWDHQCFTVSFEEAVVAACNRHQWWSFMLVLCGLTHNSRQIELSCCFSRVFFA